MDGIRRQQKIDNMKITKEVVAYTVMKKKPGLKQFPWIKTIYMFLDPDQKKYSIFQNELRTAEN